MFVEESHEKDDGWWNKLCIEWLVWIQWQKGRRWTQYMAQMNIIKLN